MKNSTILILLFIGFIPLGAAFAQKRSRGEVIYLKNGSVIRSAKGLQHQDSLIRVETTEGSIILFKPHELDRITKEVLPTRYNRSGYMFSCEWGVLTGRQYRNTQFATREPSSTFSLQIINGYRFSRLVGLGVGVGIATYNKGVLTPLFVRISGVLLPKRLSPIYTIDAGYGFYSHLLNDKSHTDQWTGATFHYSGGFLLNPAIGFQTHMNHHTAIYMLAGYLHQRFHTEVRSERIQARELETITYERLSLRMGLVF